MTQLEFIATVATRLDKFLRDQTSLGRAACQRLIAAGLVCINGRRANKGTLLQAGDVVTVARTTIQATPEPIDIISRGEGWLALNKPLGLPTMPRDPSDNDSLAQRLGAAEPEQRDVSTDPREFGLVHRLDNETTGIVIAATSPRAYLALRDQFANHTVEKTYLAVTSPPDFEQSFCTQALMQRGTRAVADEAGLPAISDFAVIYVDESQALIECRTRFGRRHQVRKHLSLLGAPLLGDTLYGGDGEGPFALHAHRVAFLDPLRGNSVTATAPPPPRIARLLEAGKLGVNQ